MKDLVSSCVDFPKLQQYSVFLACLFFKVQLKRKHVFNDNCTEYDYLCQKQTGLAQRAEEQGLLSVI